MRRDNLRVMKEIEKEDISIVIIGINVESTLGECLSSIQSCSYPQEKLETIFVDGGSTDRSVEIARNYSFVKIIELVQDQPTPGRGRNHGWKAASHQKIQFLDGDTILEKDWLDEATGYLKGGVVAVFGGRSEIYPKKNWYHLVADIEWKAPLGECKAFGGDVLVDKSVLERVGGYDELLIAGEDPDLSYRIRQSGGKILSVDVPMSKHNIQMDSFAAYFKRAARTGYAYTALAWRYRKQNEKFRLKEFLRIPLGIIIPWGLIFGGCKLGVPVIGSLLGLGLMFRSLRKIPYFSKQYQISFKESAIYALHLSFIIYPQVVGVLQFIVQKDWRNLS